MDIAINVVSSVRLAFQPFTILRASTSARNTRMLNSNAKYADGYGRTVKQSIGLYKQLKLSIFCRYIYKFTSYIESLLFLLTKTFVNHQQKDN